METTAKPSSLSRLRELCGMRCAGVEIFERARRPGLGRLDVCEQMVVGLVEQACTGHPVSTKARRRFMAMQASVSLAWLRASVR